MIEILNKELVTSESYIVTVWNLVLVAVIILLTIFAIKLISFVLKRAMTSRHKLDGRHLSVIQLVKYIVWVIALVFCLKAIKVDITFLIASSAALLVGIGLGLQNVFKDFISGIIILIEGTIKVDDIVEVEGIVVKIQEISLRTAIAISRDDKVLIIPNHKFIEDNVTNWTHNNTPTLFKLEVSVDYSSDVRLVEKILLDCAKNNDDVLEDEVYYPLIRFSDFGDSALLFTIIFWSNNLFRIEGTRSQLRFDIFEEFRKNNIVIPFPQRVIHKADAGPKND